MDFQDINPHYNNDELNKLKEQNKLLTKIINTNTNEQIKEAFDLKDLFENKLSKMKSKIERLANEREKLRTEAICEAKKANDAVSKYQTSEENYQKAQSKMISLEAKKTEFKFEHQLIENQINNLTKKELPDLRKQIVNLEKQKNQIEIELKNETAKRIRVESETNSLMKISTHKTDQHNIEMERLKSTNKHEVVEIEHSARQKLIYELNKIKNDTLKQIEERKPNLEAIYYRDLKFLKLKIVQELKNIEFMQESLNEMNKQQEASNSELNFLKLKYLFYEKRIENLEDKLERTNEKYLNDMHELDLEIEHSKREFNSWLTSHKDLNNAKLAARKVIDDFYTYLHTKGLNFKFYNLRSGKKLRT